MTVIATQTVPGATLDPATYKALSMEIDRHITLLRRLGVSSVADALESARLSVDSAKMTLDLAIDDGEVKILCPPDAQSAWSEIQPASAPTVLNLPKLPMSLKAAAAAGCERLRKAEWVGRFDHVKIDIIHGGLGPWVHLFCPVNKSLNGRDPVDTLAVRPNCDPNEQVWLPYNGPVAGSAEYQAEAAEYGQA